MSTTINVTNWFEVPVKMSLNIWVLNIPTLSPQFVFGFTTPAYNLYDRCGALISISLLLVVVAVVVVIVVVVVVVIYFE